MKALLEVYRDQFKAEPITMTFTWIALIVMFYYGGCGLYSLATYSGTDSAPHEVCHVDRMTDIETCGWSG